MHAKAVFENVGRTLAVKAMPAEALRRTNHGRAKQEIPSRASKTLRNTIQYRLSFIVQGAYFTSVYAHDTLLPGFNGQRTS